MGEFYIRGALLLVGGIIALSGLILAKRPDAKEMLSKITPYQGFIGVGLLGYGVLDLVRNLSHLGAVAKMPPLIMLGLYGWFFGSIVLGFILGMPQIAAWIPGESSAEQKVVSIQKKLLPFQTIFGAIGAVAGILLILTGAGILT